MRILMLILSVFLLTSCTSGEEVTCNVNGKEEVFTISDGMVNSITIDGTQQNQSAIDEFNGTYLTSATSNEEAKALLKEYINAKGGNCN